MFENLCKKWNVSVAEIQDACFEIVEGKPVSSDNEYLVAAVIDLLFHGDIAVSSKEN